MGFMTRRGEVRYGLVGSGRGFTIWSGEAGCCSARRGTVRLGKGFLAGLGTVQFGGVGFGEVR